MPKEPDINDLIAGEAFRQSVVDRADAQDAGEAPLWYGWVIMEAFLAGAEHARTTSTPNR